MKDRRLQIIPIIIIVIIITYGISLTKTEAPTPPKSDEVLVKDQIIKDTAKEINAPAVSEKYVIAGRSNVTPKNILNKKKVVLLTIDDGPSSRTLEIVKVLKAHNAKAIFFINGNNDKNNLGVIEETSKEGFIIGNHTWSHMNLKKQKNNVLIEKEINKNTDLIKTLTGSNPRFFRAPYGESNQQIRKKVKDDGMIFMDWSGAAKDWEKSTVEKDVFVGNVMRDVHSGSIILIHEHPWSLANLDALLAKLEEAGYTYVDPNDIVE